MFIGYVVDVVEMRCEILGLFLVFIYDIVEYFYIFFVNMSFCE